MTEFFTFLFDLLGTLLDFLTTFFFAPLRLWELHDAQEDLIIDIVDVAQYGIKLQGQIFKMEQRLAHLEAEKRERA